MYLNEIYKCLMCIVLTIYNIVRVAPLVAGHKVVLHYFVTVLWQSKLSLQLV